MEVVDTYMFLNLDVEDWMIQCSSGRGVMLCCFRQVPWRSGLVRSTSTVGRGEWLWVEDPSMVVGTPCRGP